MVNHSAGEYVNGIVHTNGIESVWASSTNTNILFKRNNLQDISQPLFPFSNSLVKPISQRTILEFEFNETQIISYRRTPEQHNEIVAFAKGRSPVNHVTAMYKKSWVLNVGNYAKYRTSEDYNLFVKLIMAGAKIYNLQESLVSVRMGIR
jgi:hypothetical protein